MFHETVVPNISLLVFSLLTRPSFSLPQQNKKNRLL